MNGIFLTYTELMLMTFGIGMLWFLLFWIMLYFLDKWGFLPEDWK
jgi:hypothetical protein